jgi:carboxyl-terminal processing protease
VREKVAAASETREKKVTTPQGINGAVYVGALVLMLGIGFVAGIYRYDILGAIAPAFGVKTSSQTIDTTALQQTYRTLLANYDGELDTNALINGASRGMVAAAGDPYTAFFDESEAEQFNNDLSGSIGGGIGAQIGIQDEVVTLVKILSGTPAERAGLKAGDTVKSINGEPTAGYTTDDAVAKLRGEIGTTVKIAITRSGEDKEFTITRAEISAPSVESELKDGIGTITITRFDSDTGALARRAAQQFKDAGVKGVILDLRGNGGGYVAAAQSVAGIWLKNKRVVTEKAGDTVVDEITTGSNTILEGVKTIVLVDGNSASASEIVAGALKDYNAATLVGTKTYGKGTVQQLLPLANGSMLKVTVARWYTPNGVNISEVGIEPDTTVKITSEDITQGNDLQRQAALNALK